MNRQSTWLRYVAHGDVARFLAEGWSVRDDLVGTNHGFYSVLMTFDGQGEPPIMTPDQIQIAAICEARALGNHLSRALEMILLADRSGHPMSNIETAVWWLERAIDTDAPLRAGPSQGGFGSVITMVSTFGLTPLLDTAAFGILRSGVSARELRQTILVLREDLDLRKRRLAQASTDSAVLA